MLRPYPPYFPDIHPNAYIDETAVIIGNVTIGAHSSVWINAVLRGDVNRIRIGERSNIQDLAMLHVSHHTAAKPEGSPLTIGDDVTIGHHVMLHGCTIGNRVLIGMSSTILDDAVIESDIIIGAGSLVPPRKVLESGFMYMGSPVKKIRALTYEEREFLKYSANHYVKLAENYRKITE